MRPRRAASPARPSSNRHSSGFPPPAARPATITPRNECIYQERYSGLPQQNAEGYPQGSPITFASRLRGDLLLVHGSGDDNVHFQGTEALINALVAAGKPLSMMEYPNRTHCICEGDGTSRHLFELLTRYLNEHLPRGDAPTH